MRAPSRVCEFVAKPMLCPSTEFLKKKPSSQQQENILGPFSNYDLTEVLGPMFGKFLNVTHLVFQCFCWLGTLH